MVTFLVVLFMMYTFYNLLGVCGVREEDYFSFFPVASEFVEATYEQVMLGETRKSSLIEHEHYENTPM